MTKLPTVQVTIDWFRVVADLRREGYSRSTLAGMLGVSRSGINLWISGSEPSYVKGNALLLFWSTTMGKPVDQAPIKAIQPSAAQVLREYGRR